jgi:hypothetical protein
MSLVVLRAKVVWIGSRYILTSFGFDVPLFSYKILPVKNEEFSDKDQKKVLEINNKTSPFRM